MAVSRTNAPPIISGEEFDRMFEAGEDLTPYLDLDNIRYPGLEEQTMALDLPTPLIEALEREAARAGCSPTDLVRSWVEDRLRLASA